MPVLDRMEALQLLGLLMCVPFQLWISYYSGSTEATRSYAVSQLVSDLSNFRSSWLQLEPWTHWCSSLLMHLTGTEERNNDMGESPAVEVFRYKSEEGYFGMSTTPRDPRPPHVKFRVGQVVHHKKFGYRGIIIAWDLKTRAPDSWISAMLGKDKRLQNQPNYAVLVDTRDRPAPQLTYVLQENVDVLINTKVLHPLVDEYFEGYDGAQYIPRPWLRTVYPKD